MDTNNFVLPQKVISALKRIRNYYETNDESILSRVINSSYVFVDYGAIYDNWNGGMHGHNVTLFVPEDEMVLIKLETQAEVSKKIKDDLHKVLPKIQDEFISEVYIEQIDENDSQYSLAEPISNPPSVNPEKTGLWAKGKLRVFLSHRDSHKAKAHELANALEPYGVTTFVAHDAIKPMKEWQKEIENGLNTMEIMLVLLTEDFHHSNWTNQEAGFALGKGIPIICLKVSNCDPQGFIGARQALKVPYDDIYVHASEIYKALIDHLGMGKRLKQIIIESFISSSSYTDAMEALQRLKSTIDSLDEAEFRLIVDGYKKNNQLYGCAGIHTKRLSLIGFLEVTTGKRLKVEGLSQITER
ncbi:toll/interleukin-1 receptor domain-containing protein [Glaciecola sp. 1036]|uniref:toll/interleukin-1 receptor domain-containing protein n=1 Tax=Alteromonadaceae TaxID=72275 RepID=UPI003D038630